MEENKYKILIETMIKLTLNSEIIWTQETFKDDLELKLKLIEFTDSRDILNCYYMPPEKETVRIYLIRQNNNNPDEIEENGGSTKYPFLLLGTKDGFVNLRISILELEWSDVLQKLYDHIYTPIIENNINELLNILSPQEAESGNFTFNYSNHNGERKISSNNQEFTTKWSKASRTSIHAYNDAPDIECIALIKKVEDVKEITLDTIHDIPPADFSSRARTAQKGDAIIWKNINGIYAATKIIRIMDDTRGDDHDELECEYVIFN